MKATAKQKKDEFARGDLILAAAQDRWRGANITRPKLNIYSVSYEGKYAGSFSWRLGDDGMGSIKWKPSSEFIDIAPRRPDFVYNYVDEISDVDAMYVWASPIFNDILA